MSAPTMLWLQKLRPRLFLRSIYDIDLDKLKSLGISGIIMDLDNTLVKWRSSVPTTKLVAWLTEVKRRGFKLCVVSNNTENSVNGLLDDLNIPAIYNASKPRRSPFRTAMELMGTNENNTAVVGDQVFTDILGGNRLGLYTILVLPVGRREMWTTKFMRVFERAVLKLLKSQGLLEEDYR